MGWFSRAVSSVKSVFSKKSSPAPTPAQTSAAQSFHSTYGGQQSSSTKAAQSFTAKYSTPSGGSSSGGKVSGGGGGGGGSSGGGSSSNVISTPSGKMSVGKPTSIQQVKVEAKQVSPSQVKQKLQSTVTAAPQTDRSFKNVFGLGEKIAGKQREISTRESRGQGGFMTGAKLTALGFASSLVGGARLVTDPIGSAKSIFKSAKEPIKTGKTIKQQLTTGFKTSPSFTVGALAGDYALLKSPTLIRKGVTTGVDVARTTGKVKIAESKVIAPEYFAGQKYPAIKKGQTAGSLLGEFKPVKELGETRAAGFTASPSPLKGKPIITGRGSSELPGLYQAPKLSPQFLKVASEEKKMFGLNPFGTLRPTASRITPTRFELTKGVRSSQKGISPLKKAQEFFETKAEKGKSYVPFIKTEKEAIIPFGTELVPKKTKGYFKFEGRRIPIKEYETVTTKTNIEVPKPTTARKVFASSSRRVGRTSRYDPLSITSSSAFLKSSGKSSLTSSSRIIKPSSSSRGLISRRGSGADSSYYGRGGGSSYYGRGGRTSYGGGSSYGRGGGSLVPGVTVVPIKGGFKFGGKIFKQKKSRIKVRPPRRLPSLLAIGRGIKSTSRGNIEGSGLTVRPILVSKRRVSKKRKSSKRKKRRE